MIAPARSPALEMRDDFAEEASYSPVTIDRRQPEAPILRPDHVWGVREDWGKKVGKWGQGAKLYETDGKDPDRK